jgi:hypothetical protein
LVSPMISATSAGPISSSGSISREQRVGRCVGGVLHQSSPRRLGRRCGLQGRPRRRHGARAAVGVRQRLG